MRTLLRNVGSKIKIDKISMIIRNTRKIALIVFRLSPIAMIISICIYILQSLIPISQVYVTKKIIDEVTILFGTQGGFDQLHSAFMYLSLQILLYIITVFLNSLSGLINFKIQQHVNYYFQLQIKEKSTKIPYHFFDNSEFYNKLERVSIGLDVRALGLFFTFISASQVILTMSGFFALFLSYHWILGAGLIILLFPPAIVNVKVARSRFNLNKVNTPLERKMQYISRLFKSKMGAKELRVFGHSGYLLRQWKEYYWKNSNTRTALEQKSTYQNASVTLINNIVGALFISVLIWLGSVGKLSIGLYVAFVEALNRIQNSMIQLAKSFGSLYENSLFIEELLNFLSLPEEDHSSRTRNFPNPLKECISLDNVYFSYPNRDNFSLKGVSFTIGKGEKVALVGENGAGKSTLVKCLLSLYEPTAGSIYFDGIDAKEIKKESIKENISIVFQDFVRYEMSARENIGFGKVEQIDDMGLIQSAALKTGASEIIETLPFKYDSVLGSAFEKGVDLSGGQWQKMALARTCFRDSQIVVLDEPTASLDPMAEFDFFNNFLRQLEGKTIIIISHRLGICQIVDKILLLKDGRIVEEGTHDELLNKSGEYRRMYLGQAQWYQIKDNRRIGNVQSFQI